MEEEVKDEELDKLAKEKHDEKFDHVFHRRFTSFLGGRTPKEMTSQYLARKSLYLPRGYGEKETL